MAATGAATSTFTPVPATTSSVTTFCLFRLSVCDKQVKLLLTQRFFQTYIERGSEILHLLADHAEDLRITRTVAGVLHDLFALHLQRVQQGRYQHLLLVWDLQLFEHFRPRLLPGLLPLFRCGSFTITASFTTLGVGCLACNATQDQQDKSSDDSMSHNHLLECQVQPLAGFDATNPVAA